MTSFLAATSEAGSGKRPLAAYLRVASLAVAVYDFFLCLPASWRIYKVQWNSSRITVSFILYFLIQLTSILALTSSNVAFFSSDFTKKTCDHFYLIPPIFKFVQGFVSQVIMGVRTYNVSQRSRRVGAFLLLLLFSSSSLSGVAIIGRRTEIYSETQRNCQAKPPTDKMAPWVYHLLAMIYDLATTVIIMGYLYKLQLSHPTSLMSKLTKMMVWDGLGYFVALTAVNVLNLILYRAPEDIRTAGASLGYCVTWIMSARLLIHLNKASLERHRASDPAITITQTIDSSREISRAMRSQFEPKNAYDLTVPDFDLTTIEEGQVMDDVGGVEVRIERTFRVERKSKVAYQLENYSRPSSSRSRGGQ